MKKFLLLKIVAITLLLGSCKIVNIVEKPTKPSKEVKKYDLIEVFYDGFANVSHNGKWGRIDTTGKEIIPIIYDGISTIDNESYSIIHKNNKMGVISNNGELKIAPTFDEMYYSKSMRFIVNIAGLWGVVDEYGNEIIANQFDEILLGLDDYAIVNRGNKFGIINIETGEIILPCTYDEIQDKPFEILHSFVVKNGELTGVYDVEKRLEIIPTIHYGVSILSEDYFKIEKEIDESILVEIVNKDNETVIPAQLGSIYYYIDDSIFVLVQETGAKFYSSEGKLFADVEDYTDPSAYDGSIFYNGFASVQVNKKWKFMNLKGVLTMNKYDGLEPFDTNGLAEVCIDCEEIGTDYERFHIRGKWGIIDTTGKEIVSPKFNDINSYYINDLAIVNDSCIFDEAYFNCLGGKQGVIDQKGNIVLPVAFDQVTFSDLFIFVNNGIQYDSETYSYSGGLIGIFDAQGKEIAPIIYEDIFEFQTEGLFKVQKDKRWGLMDYTGKLVTEIIYDEIYQSKIGEFIVSVHGVQNEVGDWEHGQYYLINTKGEKLLKNTYEYLDRPYAFDSYISKKNGKYGVISDSEVELISHNFDYIQTGWKSGVYYVNVGGKYNSSTQEVDGGTWGLFKEGNVCLVKFIYDHIEDVNENGELYILKSNNKYSLCDADGKTLTKTSYDQIVNLYQTVLGVEKDGKIGGLNSKGEVVIPIEYEKLKYCFGNEYFLVNKESNLYHPD